MLCRIALAGLLSLTLAAGVAAEKPADPPAKLEPAKCGEIDRLHRFGDIFLASQPREEDFKLLKREGVRTVINLREDEEIDWDERAAVERLKLDYEHVPIGSLNKLTDETFDRLRELLLQASERPVVLHCAVANRVGAVWLAHRILDGGLDDEAALKEAKAVGLKSPELEQAARDYVARVRAARAQAR
ncbi:MAG: protein tyrosine phosphatase family protein [Planctomyces sp.]|nr:protein tyrosine phosphatase family protein [Planctomyces sp.]